MDISKIHRLNNATIFLLPLIPLDKGIFDFVMPYKGKSSRLLNAYIYDIDVPKYHKKHVTLVHSNLQDIGFKTFEKILENHKCCVDSYDIANTEYNVKVFKIPDNSLLSYEAFLRGKYSQFCLHDIANVLHFDYLNQGKYLHKVFSKDKELRFKKEELLGTNLEGKELWSIYDPEYDLLHGNLKDKLSSRKIQSNQAFLNEK
tara:strand:+ start:317 stop:922 length:606 start_codon:yes stop_codon:yes gene_type:complete